MRQDHGTIEMMKDRVSLPKTFKRRLTPTPLITKKAKAFAAENHWLADIRVMSKSLPLGHTWLEIDDREGHMISIEGKARSLMDMLDIAQDQWDIARQYVGRIFSLETHQFETARVLYRDGLPLDTAIEAARRL